MAGSDKRRIRISGRKSRCQRCGKMHKQKQRGGAWVCCSKKANCPTLVKGGVEVG